MSNSISLGIIIKLMNQKRVKASELAQMFEVSTRTIYRYVDSICASGVPIITINGKNGGIEIADSFNLKNDVFTSDELLYLLNILQSENSIKNNTLIEKIKKNIKKL